MLYRILALVAILVAGCGSGSENQDENPQNVTVEWSGNFRNVPGLAEIYDYEAACVAVNFGIHYEGPEPLLQFSSTPITCSVGPADGYTLFSCNTIIIYEGHSVSLPNTFAHETLHIFLQRGGHDSEVFPICDPLCNQQAAKDIGHLYILARYGL